MSAWDDLPTKSKGFRIGIDDYMVKPVELAELEMRVRALSRRANIETEIDTNLDRTNYSSDELKKLYAARWEMDQRTTYKNGVLELRRNHKIVNKMELARLQRNFEACMDEIRTLEHSKTSNATIILLIVGIVGTAFMAGAVFAATATVPMWPLCVLMEIPGFAGWIIPPFRYKKLVEKRTKVVDDLIKDKYEEIYQVCEKGYGLL